jgi:hypothetical protein
MATNNGHGRGVPTLPSTLIRPTNPNPGPSPVEPEPSPLESDEPDGPVEGQGRGDQRASASGSAVPKPRRKKAAAPAEKLNKRGLHLTDSVWDRLQYEAIRRKTTVSAIAGDVLERNLPRFQVTREG